MVPASSQQEAPKVLATMWKCPHCGANSFMGRHKCFVCERKRPAKPTLVEEKWKESAIPRMVQQRGAGGGAPEELRGGRVEHGGSIDDGPRGVAGRMLAGRRNYSPGRRDTERRRDPAGRREEEQRENGGRVPLEKSANGTGLVAWADVVRAEAGSAKTENPPAARSKAKAKPKAKGRGREEEPRAGERTEEAPLSELSEDQDNRAGEARPKEEEGDDGHVPIPPPYQPPPLPRFLLAHRAKELHKRVSEMEQKDPADPRIAVAKAHQESTGALLREAGGHSSRRLCFSVLEADAKIRKCTSNLQKAEEELEQANEKVKEVLRQQEKADTMVAACHAALLNAKAKRAHLGCQVAVDASREVDGVADLMAAMGQLAAWVQTSGNQRLQESMSHVAHFVGQFQPTVYDAKADPVLNEIASVDSSLSEATIIMDWQAEKRGEKRTAHGEEKVDGPCADAALERLNAVAANAVVNLQITAVQAQKETTVPGEQVQLCSLAERAAKVPIPETMRSSVELVPARRAQSLGPRQIRTEMLRAPGASSRAFVEPGRKLLAIEDNVLGSELLPQSWRQLNTAKEERGRSRTPTGK